MTLRLGFIGGGINSAVGYVHKIASQMDNHWILTAGCFSEDRDINYETAKRWGISVEHVYPSFKELITYEKNNLDAIAILTPTSSHMDIIISVLNAGIPVISEKALCTSVVEAIEIGKTLDETKGYLAVTYNYTGYPMVRELRELILRGDLGELIQIHVEMPQEGFIKLNPDGSLPVHQAWRLRDYTIPTISLDLGVHLHSIVSFLTNKSPVEVVSVHNNFGRFKGIVDNVIGIVRYTNDLICNMWFSKCSIGHRNGLRIRIYGKNGSAEWYQLNPEELILNTVYGERIIKDRASRVYVASEQRYNRFKAGHPAGFIEAFANVYRDIAESVRKFKKGEEYRSPYVFGFEHSLAGLKLFEAMVRSAKEHAWIKIE